MSPVRGRHGADPDEVQLRLLKLSKAGDRHWALVHATCDQVIDTRFDFVSTGTKRRAL